MSHSLVVLVPGSIETNTGGYIYDRRMVAGLRALGWSVTVCELDESFPQPTPAALAAACLSLAAIDGGQLVLIDGLAGGAMPDELAHEAERLRLVALVHHPLAAETGLAPALAQRFEACERAALASVRRVIVTSHATAAALSHYGVPRERIAVVEPGTERAPAATGSSDGIVRLLCVATLTARKGHETLFRALAPLTHLSWHLTCVGSLDRDPATTARLRALLEQHQLTSRVLLAGETGEAGLRTFYDRADVFVLPTEHEGYGMAVAEAIAHGLPVVSTPTGGIPAIVTARAGLLVQAGDVAALTAALTTMIEQPEARARFAGEAILARDRLPTWRVAALTMADALEGAMADERIQR